MASRLPALREQKARRKERLGCGFLLPGHAHKLTPKRVRISSLKAEAAGGLASAGRDRIRSTKQSGKDEISTAPKKKRA